MIAGGAELDCVDAQTGSTLLHEVRILNCCIDTHSIQQHSDNGTLLPLLLPWVAHGSVVLVSFRLPEVARSYA